MQGQNGHNGGQQEKNEFDDLISALRTGDVFGENMDKFKRSRKIRHSPPRVDRVDSFLRERESNGLNQVYLESDISILHFKANGSLFSLHP